MRLNTSRMWYTDKIDTDFLAEKKGLFYEP